MVKVKMDSIPTHEQFKKIVKEIFDTKYRNTEYKLSHVYNLVSREYGFKDWNTLSAFLKRNDSKIK